MKKREIKKYFSKIVNNNLTSFDTIKDNIDYDSILASRNNYQPSKKLLSKRLLFTYGCLIIFMLLVLGGNVNKPSDYYSISSFQDEFSQIEESDDEGLSYNNIATQLDYLNKKNTFYELEFTTVDDYYTCGYVAREIYELVTSYKNKDKIHDFLYLYNYNKLVDEGQIDPDLYPIKWVEVNKEQEVKLYYENYKLMFVLGSRNVKINMDVYNNKSLNIDSKIFFEYDWYLINGKVDPYIPKGTRTNYQVIEGRILLYDKEYTKKELNNKIINSIFPNITKDFNSFYYITKIENREYIEIPIGLIIDDEHIEGMYAASFDYYEQIFQAIQNGHTIKNYKGVFYQVGYFDYERVIDLFRILD